jgi:16S rRNA (cytidine1402-2'-O)-methyltransferase
VTAALSISGLRDNGFVFAGFPPIRSKDRKLWLEWLSTLDGLPAIFFEAPHRLDRTLSDLHLYLGERPISVARELTKLHEEWVTGAIPAISGALTTRKGEFVVLVHPSRKADDAPVVVSDERVALVFGEMTQNVSSRREAIRRTADRLGMPARDVFAALERARRSPE